MKEIIKTLDKKKYDEIIINDEIIIKEDAQGNIVELIFPDGEIKDIYQYFLIYFKCSINEHAILIYRRSSKKHELEIKQNKIIIYKKINSWKIKYV